MKGVKQKIPNVIIRHETLFRIALKAFLSNPERHTLRQVVDNKRQIKVSLKPLPFRIVVALFPTKMDEELFLEQLKEGVIKCNRI